MNESPETSNLQHLTGCLKMAGVFFVALAVPAALVYAIVWYFGV